MIPKCRRDLIRWKSWMKSGSRPKWSHNGEEISYKRWSVTAYVTNEGGVLSRVTYIYSMVNESRVSLRWMLYGIWFSHIRKGEWISCLRIWKGEWMTKVPCIKRWMDFMSAYMKRWMDIEVVCSRGPMRVRGVSRQGIQESGRHTPLHTQAGRALYMSVDYILVYSILSLTTVGVWVYECV